MESQTAGAAAEKKSLGTRTDDPKLVAITKISRIVKGLKDADRSIVLRYLYEDFRADFPTE
jgi:hypothetical protein